MNKLEYELNQVAEKAAKEAAEKAKRDDIAKFIAYAKSHGSDAQATIQDTLNMFSDSLDRDEIIKMVEEAYQ